MATPSANRRKDVLGGPSARPRTLTVTPEPDEIPLSSAIQAVSCTPRASASVQNRQGRCLPAAQEQTPTRGPLKHIEPCGNVSLNGKQPEICSGPSGTRSSARDSVSNKDIARLHSFPSLPPSTLKTPTKVRPANPQPKPNTTHWGIEDTPVKVCKVPCGTIQEKPRSPNTMDENSISIYESLGWNDDIDELS